MLQRLHTPETAAAALNLTPEQVLKMIQKGLLPAEKVGGVWVIEPRDVERLRVRKVED
jgi:excisionase family DNA binding protein